jgi:predicted transcriptional regulator
LQERVAWLDRQIEEFRERHGNPDSTPPERSARRATARRASTRRATARQHKGDVSAGIINYLKDHPQSTAGDVAKGLNANRNTIATRLSQMVKAGEITKASKGYAAK